MFVPHHNLVTVVLDKKDKTPGGLILPDIYAEVFITGTVRAVGVGHRLDTGDLDAPSLCKGDRVMIAQHVQQQGQRRLVQKYPEIEDDGVACILCDYTDVLGVIK